jgi:hypothetical protein
VYEALVYAEWEKGGGNTVGHIQLSLHDLSQLVMVQAERGKSREEIVQLLVERGWPKVSAVRFVNTTLTEQAGQSTRAQMPDDDPQQANQAFMSDQESWRILLVVVLVTAIFIACMLLAYAQ